jgi:hypothetical protein
MFPGRLVVHASRRRHAACDASRGRRRALRRGALGAGGGPDGGVAGRVRRRGRDPAAVLRGRTAGRVRGTRGHARHGAAVLGRHAVPGQRLLQRDRRLVRDVLAGRLGRERMPGHGAAMCSGRCVQRGRPELSRRDVRRARRRHGGRPVRRLARPPLHGRDELRRRHLPRWPDARDRVRDRPRLRVGAAVRTRSRGRRRDGARVRSARRTERSVHPRLLFAGDLPSWLALRLPHAVHDGRGQRRGVRRVDRLRRRIGVQRDERVHDGAWRGRTVRERDVRRHAPVRRVRRSGSLPQRGSLRRGGAGSGVRHELARDRLRCG